MEKQKTKFTQTDTFQIAKAVAMGTAYVGGLLLGMAVVETAVRKVIK